nr:hypothetical protein [Tanacetum cinerariifolium]
VAGNCEQWNNNLNVVLAGMASTLYLLLTISLIYDVKFTLTQTTLDAFCEKYHIRDTVHPELPGHNQNIRNSPADVLEYFRINPSQLSVIAVAKMDQIAFIRHAVLTKVWIGERQIKERQNENTENLNEGGGDVVQESHSGKADRADGASGSDHPLKKLKENNGISSASASTARKYLVALQGVLECCTLAVEAGVMAVATVTFVTSSVTPTPEREGGDAEVTSIVRARAEPAVQSIFVDSASPSAAKPNIDGPSNPIGTKLSADTFYVSQEMDSETLCQIYVPKWNTLNESIIDDHETAITKAGTKLLLHEAYFSCSWDTLGISTLKAIDGGDGGLKGGLDQRVLRPLSPKTLLLSVVSELEKNVEIANLKAQLSLKEVEATEAIHLHNQVITNEATEVSRVSELESVKEQNSVLKEEKDALEGKVATLESATANRESELALRDQVLGYELFKEPNKAVQDEQVKRWILSHGIRLAVMKCLQSPEYVTVLGTFIGLPLTKDANIADIMSLLHLEGPSAETIEVSRLQPSYEQLHLPIHRKEDNVVTKETSMSNSLDVVHARVPTTAAATSTLAISVTTANVSSIPPISVADYSVLDVQPHYKAHPSLKIVFEKEDLETKLEHPTAS